MKKKIIISAVLFVIAFAIYQRVVNGDKIDKANIERAREVRKEFIADSTSKANNINNKDEALSAVKKEKKVKEAIMTEANVLYVAVLDDGTRRDGYAEYLCSVLKEYGVQMRIKVVKFGSTNSPKRDNAYGILLGESWCKQ